MGVITNEHREILNYLKSSIRHLREPAGARPDQLRTQILEATDEIAAGHGQALRASRYGFVAEMRGDTYVRPH